MERAEFKESGIVVEHKTPFGFAWFDPKGHFHYNGSLKDIVQSYKEWVKEGKNTDRLDTASSSRPEVAV